MKTLLYMLTFPSRKIYIGVTTGTVENRIIRHVSHSKSRDYAVHRAIRKYGRESIVARVLALRVKGKPYALFGPTGTRWESVSATEWIARLPSDKRYVAAAVLPDDKAETLALLTRHAYAFVQVSAVAPAGAVPGPAQELFLARTGGTTRPDNIE